MTDTEDEATPELDEAPGAQERAEKCYAKITELLEEFDCELVPFLAEPLPVGTRGSTVQISATYGVIPKT